MNNFVKFLTVFLTDKNSFSYITPPVAAFGFPVGPISLKIFYIKNFLQINENVLEVLSVETRNNILEIAGFNISLFIFSVLKIYFNKGVFRNISNGYYEAFSQK